MPQLDSESLTEFQVYTLRLERSLAHQTAMTLTYFPGKDQVSGTRTRDRIHGMIMGYDEVDTMELKMRLGNCKKAIFSPFTLIKAFLHVEKRRRFKEINDKIAAFQNILQNYGRVPIGNELAESRSSNEGNRLGDGADDPKKIQLYLEMCALKNALEAWNAQLRSLREDVIDDGGGGEFGADTAADIDPREYLRRLVEEYDVKINRCDTVLQGGSLTFQMVMPSFCCKISK